MKELVLEVECFNLKYTLECGQCFRWKYQNDDSYIGIIKDRVIKVSQRDNKLYITSNKEENLERVVMEYFDLNTNYEEIEREISYIDEYISMAVKNTTGIRNLNQDFFETLISYIISANNNIPRITKSVNCISQRYGKEVAFQGEKYYLFPTAEELRETSIDDYRNCGVGFRDKYIYDVVNEILSGKFKIEDVIKKVTEELRIELMKLKGVGPKVADCILLFSCSRKSVFPVDVWVERVMRKLYFNNNDLVSKKQILEYAKENFSKNAGIIQQHLFYNIRENML